MHFVVRFFSIFVLFAAISPLAIAQDTSFDVKELQRLALNARIHSDALDRNVVEMADKLRGADTSVVQQKQREIEAAFMWVCDADVLAQMKPETMQAVDDTLETHFTLEDIHQGSRWDALAYVHGFFNHDVMPDEIREIAEGWLNMTFEERAPRYPNYVHVIDSACKPLSTGELKTKEDTLAAFGIALPLLKGMFTAPPGPGTAYHEPTHSILVLAAIYNRWENSETYGAIVKKYLGERAAFERYVAGQLVASQDGYEAFEEMERQFYGYTGRYIANALARLGATSSVDLLQKSLAFYERTSAPSGTVLYTKRALAALGDKEQQQWLQGLINVERSQPQTVEMLAWIARNAKHQDSLNFANRLLGEYFHVDAEEGLQAYFEHKLQTLK